MGKSVGGSVVGVCFVGGIVGSVGGRGRRGKGIRGIMSGGA